MWDRESANNVDFADQIARADFIYLSGGKPGYLYDTLNDSLAWQAIVQVVARGGLLAGCSAGAMIQGEVFAGFRRGGQQPGFGLWPGINVIPHFDEIPSAMVTSMRMLVGRKITVVGVEGNTALLWKDSQFEVIGQGVTVWMPDHKTRYTEGPLVDDALSSMLNG